MENEIKNEIFSWLKTIMFAIVFALIITNFIIVNAKVPTGSMENNIMPKNRIIANRLSYMFDSPKRFDIVVFKYPDDEKILFVKRIIGLPGEVIQIINGKVYVNGSETELEDSFIKEPTNSDEGPFSVPENSYFMMGDNRNDSIDSRFWKNKYVAKDKILGKVIFRYYPTPKLYNNVKF